MKTCKNICWLTKTFFMKKITLLMSIFALMVTTSVSAQLLDENFEDQAANTRWFGDALAYGNCDFDYAAKYSDEGVTSVNGGDYCMKLSANLVEDAAGEGQGNYIGLLPMVDFTGDYTVTFDAYMHYEGTSGTTEAMYIGINDGQNPETVGFSFFMTADGGSGSDIRLYKDGTSLDYDAANYMGTTKNFNLEPEIIETYYQAAVAGNDAGNQWLSMSIEVTSTSITFLVNGTEFAKFNEGPGANTNLAIGYVDPFTGSVNTTSKMLVDNVEVTQGTLALKNNELSEVSVYPNPAKGMVNVSIEGKANFQLFNISGQSVMNRDINGTTSIDISSIKSGMYFSRITSESGAVKTLKLQVK